MKVQKDDVFGLLTVIERSTRKSKGGTQLTVWQCNCVCGNYHIADEINLKAGNVTRCKICTKERKSAAKKTHGLSGHNGLNVPKVYYTWSAMKRRCYYQKDSRYADYGGRGITVCDRWKESFENFLADMGEPPTQGHSIERIDNSLNYSKENCRWASFVEQSNNKRNNIVITREGVTDTLPNWCRQLGINYNVAKKRYYNSKGDVDYTLSTKVKKGIPYKYTVDGVEFDSLKYIAQAHAMSVSGVNVRINSPTYPNWQKMRELQNYE
jgi:hypothetical protein